MISLPRSNLDRGTVRQYLARIPKPATDPHTGSTGSGGPISLCEPWREQIEQALERGLSIQRIYQDLVSERQFAGSYYAVRRFMDHRIREVMKQGKGLLCGTIEMDETYVGGKEKNKHKSKRTKGVHGRSTATKSPVIAVQPGRAYLADINFHLAISYKAVRDDVEGLITLLKGHQEKHCKEYSLKARTRLSVEKDATKIAAWLIYLNKTCYNGLCRKAATVAIHIFRRAGVSRNEIHGKQTTSAALHSQAPC